MLSKKFLWLLLIPITTQAMQEADQALYAQPVNTYCDELLTPETIVHYAPQLPTEDAEHMRLWLAGNPELVARLVVQAHTYHSLREVGDIHRENMSWLTEHGFRNNARTNYVIDEPTGRYVVKISGEFNRLENHIVNSGIPRYFIRQGRQNVTDEEISALADTDTYQTISYMPVFLRYLELHRLHPLRHVVVPPTFLLHAPGRPETVSDKNYVVVQAKTDRTVQFKKDELRISESDYAQLHQEDRARIEEARARLAALSPEHLYELVQLIFYCGLWNLNTNLYITPHNQLAIEDLEQPNVTPSEGFYLQEVSRETPHFICFGKERYKRNVESGTNELYGLFAPDSPQAQLILEYAEQIAAHYNDNLGIRIDIRKALGLNT